MTNAIGYASPLYYRHSGQFSAIGLAVAIIGSLAAAVGLGAVYAYIDLYCPLVYINFIATVGFGLAVGFVAAYLLRRGQVRNNTATLAVGVAAALVALYSAWVFWIYALFQKSASGSVSFNPLDLALRPAGLWRLIQVIDETGTWSIGHFGSTARSDGAVSGVWLWAVWAIEAGVIVWLCIWYAAKTGKSLPYCEKCQKWCGPGKRLFSTPPGDPDTLRQKLEAKDFTYLISLGPDKKPLPANWFEVYLQSCDHCRDLNALTVNAVSMQVNKKGQQERKERALVAKLLLGAKDVQTLRSLKDQSIAAQSAAPVGSASVAPAPPADPIT